MYFTRNKYYKKYKISIIYTYSKIAAIVERLNIRMKLIVSEIRSEAGLKLSIDSIKDENKKKIKEGLKYIDFKISYSKKIKL